MKKFVKNCLSTLLFYTGVYNLVLWRHRHYVTIFVGHGVIDIESCSWQPLWNRHSSDQLNNFMRWLTPRFNIVTLDEAVAMISGEKPVEPYTAVMTFDDGYRNNLDRVGPIMAQFGAPYCVYIATGFVEERRLFPIDRIDYALQQIKTPTHTVRTSLLEFTFTLEPRQALIDGYEQFWVQLKNTYDDDRIMARDLDQLATELEAETGTALSNLDDEVGGIIKVEEIASPPAGVAWGAHSVNHYRAGHVPADVYRTEVALSKTRLEALAGHDMAHYAYPNGNFSDEAVADARAAGFKSATTCVAGANPPGTDPLRLNRLPLPRPVSKVDLYRYLCIHLVRQRDTA